MKAGAQFSHPRVGLVGLVTYRGGKPTQRWSHPSHEYACVNMCSTYSNFVCVTNDVTTTPNRPITGDFTLREVSGFQKQLEPQIGRLTWDTVIG